MKCINMICGPRNMSTALMYSFNNRTDTTAVDEPFYASYLSNVNTDHPGENEILAAQSNDPSVVISKILDIESDVVFIKNMAHHIRKEMDHSFMLNMENPLLIRDPKQLIASFQKVIPNPTMEDIGLKRSYELMQWLDKNNKEITVVDSGDLLKDPKTILSILCSRLNIPFESKMLKWEKGPKNCDGVWAKYWYKNVHESTCFVKQKTSERPLPNQCKNLYEEAMEYYIALRKYSIT